MAPEVIGEHHDLKGGGFLANAFTVTILRDSVRSFLNHLG